MYMIDTGRPRPRRIINSTTSKACGTRGPFPTSALNAGAHGSEAGELHRPTIHITPLGRSVYHHGGTGIAAECGSSFDDLDDLLATSCIRWIY